uniref:Sushi domain-containing protein n=1 Tax=Ficedula albicollis TaxID=59894 RepID=A0A803VH17_FICAL
MFPAFPLSGENEWRQLTLLQLLTQHTAISTKAQENLARREKPAPPPRAALEHGQFPVIPSGLQSLAPGDGHSSTQGSDLSVALLHRKFFLEIHNILYFPPFLEPRCPKPDVPHGKEVDESRGDYRVGSQVRMECEEGFALLGPELITCGDDLSWKPNLPFCDKVCGPPPQIPFGWHSESRDGGFPYGSQVRYRCAEGLSLVGSESLFCTSQDGENLTWSGAAPECRGECGAREWGQTLGSGYGIRDLGQGQGFGLQGAAQSQCQADGTWHPPLPTCQPGESQPSPAQPSPAQPCPALPRGCSAGSQEGFAGCSLLHLLPPFDFPCASPPQSGAPSCPGRRTLWFTSTSCGTR